MGTLTVDGMTAVEKSKKDRAEALKALTSKPYNVNDDEQQAALKKYINDFEYHANLMYLFQGMSTGLTAWGGSWLAGFLLPIPEFANYFLSMFLYCGAAGYILQNFSLADFHSQLDEMKTIYNWCLKKNQTEYDGVDNTNILSNPDIQRMIKLMAPLCSTEFMLVWKNVTATEETKTSIWSSLYNAYSLFSSSKSDVDLNRLQDLKASVERRELDVGVYKGVEGAIRYFATDTHFRELLMAKVKQPVDQIRDMLPSVLTFGHSKSE
ncbi:hypothetical protein OQJ19_15735 [Fluoribacter gormanii]|uniref:Phosphatase n=1 Tax=Fluoribacter gormanii TaxID=464 RepID=A0A377GJL7_9GAMM|nr:hypothetical protein [Fluoribacter gormanii]KTD05161.1 phosphatase [Fluoribacter gormanii]MCW8472084.1 hypothetical protein [Fluoribacter gormanii]SIR88655.1 hypothetical protein SAMN05421777_1365 [Fluoribacter gormanii]STO24794.1 Uncharacterised protein [Fluoribacter gormanii]